MIKSYVDLIKRLKLVEPKAEAYKEIFSEIELQAALEEEYNGFPVEVNYAILPIVIGDGLQVKIVTMEQGESFAVIIPDNVGEVFKKLQADSELLNTVNMGLSLVVDNAGFEDTSALYELVRKTYLSAGQYAPAFDTTEIKEQKPKEDEAEFEPSRNFGSSFKGNEIEVDDTVLDTPEITESKKAYQQFVKQTQSLESLVKQIEELPKVLVENIDIKLVNGTLLSITVDNKSVYNELKIVPEAAKKLISQFGEKLKATKNVQLVETFSNKKGGRVFIVAEAVGNNYFVSEEDVLQYTLKSGLVEVQDKDLIVLNGTSVRMDERKRKAYVSNNVILFEDLEV